MLLALGCATSCEDYEENRSIVTVQAFIEQAAMTHLFQISAGNIAAHKGSMAEVANYGKMLAADHTNSGNDLKTLAGQKEITFPKIMSQDKTEKVITLQNATGAAFDKLFSQMQLKEHQETITLYEKADKDIPDAQVKAFIQRNLPGLRMHLQEANRLNDMMK